ncbi:membrane protein [Thiohalobacter sp. COW1]|uniref:Protein-S-isoprenylcysteine methyltransferase n=1 Tax=Thiohalobacter thiocyanaticus TaxID=585455 RepID=A0A1Z4VP29_9GAMM|nr:MULTISPECIES: hypothetical protein [Thiohalobacter]BAZ93253.1 protein-S-isoprenylcysteine methyltransferase [Thiohalobacter thiocyanaticus]BCO31718.1 membrane protein [Thiohalobacter sp. COW1]
MAPSPFSVSQAALLTFVWLLYLALHSLLADARVRRRFETRWPLLERRYRLFYTLQSSLLILPPLALLVLWYDRGEPLWAWQGMAGWFADGLALLALAGFAWATRAYDLAAFLGLKAATGHANITGFHLSPLHRHVRHPWYSLGLVVLWTRDMPPALLVTALCITAYLLVGIRLEERKLIDEFGERYREYRRRVPALIPRPWRRLTVEEARRLSDPTT